jgi:hypothetical protein
LDELGDHRQRRDDEQFVSAASVEAGEDVVNAIKRLGVLFNDDILTKEPSQFRNLRRQWCVA